MEKISVDLNLFILTFFFVFPQLDMTDFYDDDYDLDSEDEDSNLSYEEDGDDDSGNGEL